MMYIVDWHSYITLGPKEKRDCCDHSPLTENIDEWRNDPGSGGAVPEGEGDRS